MTEIVRFDTATGSLLAEVDDRGFGAERIARNDRGIIEAGQRMEEALTTLRPALESVVRTVTAMAPAECEIEFGLKLNAEAGVVVAKTAIEGHFNVKLTWQRSGRPEGTE